MLFFKLMFSELWGLLDL